MLWRWSVLILALSVGCSNASDKDVAPLADPKAPANKALTANVAQPAGGACIANDLELGTGPQDDLRSDCRRSGPQECERSCEAGDPKACVELAYSKDDSDEAAAEALYARACRMGSYNACVNYAGALYHSQDTARQACAFRLFQMTCERGEPFGCGMLALAHERGKGTAKAPDTALALAEKKCGEMGFFPCAALGRILEPRGRIPEAIKAFERACATGNNESCADAQRLSITQRLTAEPKPE